MDAVEAPVEAAADAAVYHTRFEPDPPASLPEPAADFKPVVDDTDYDILTPRKTEAVPPAKAAVPVAPREITTFEPDPEPELAPLPEPEPELAPEFDDEAVFAAADEGDDFTDPEELPTETAFDDADMPKPELAAAPHGPSDAVYSEAETPEAAEALANMPLPAPENPSAPPKAQHRSEVTVMEDKIRLSRVVLTNDDGIDAAGLAVLAEIAADLADEVWIFAPEHDQSGVAMSLALHHPRRVFPRGRLRYAVSGSPADCVALAHHIMRDNRPQLLLSGINIGQNAGDDTNLSGTLGAALMGLMLRIPAIGISQSFSGERRNIRWDTARAHLPHLLQTLLQQGWRKETCLSINMPDLPPEEVREAVWTRQAPRTITGMNVEKRTDLRGFDYYWLNLARPQHEHVAEDTDIAALRRGQISVSCIGLDRSRSMQQDSIGLIPAEDLQIDL